MQLHTTANFAKRIIQTSLKKGTIARAFITHIIEHGGKIICSELVKNELVAVGYSPYEIESLFSPLQNIITMIYSNRRQFGKAKDISKKRNIPLFDALHAILARDHKAIIITRDKHFDKLLDIIPYKKPEDLI